MNNHCLMTFYSSGGIIWDLKFKLDCMMQQNLFNNDDEIEIQFKEFIIAINHLEEKCRTT